MGRAAGVLQAPSTVHLFSFRILPRIFRSTKAESERSRVSIHGRNLGPSFPPDSSSGKLLTIPTPRGEESGAGEGGGNTLLQASLATISHNGISERCRLEIRLESLLAVECHVGDTAESVWIPRTEGGGEEGDGVEIGRGVATDEGSQCPLDASTSMVPCRLGDGSLPQGMDRGWKRTKG